MNSAFLLVATAWLAAGDPAPAHPAPAIVSAPAACSGGSCGATYGHGGACCDACADDCCCRESFFQRLMSRFHRSNDCCESTCDACCTTTTHAHASTCCDACADDCCRPSFFDRLRSMFSRHRDSDCCDTGCDTGCGCGNGSYGAPAYHGAPSPYGAPALTPTPGVMPKAEQVPAPKDPGKDPGQPLPKGDKDGDKPDKISTPAIDGNPAAPRAGEGEAKSPFELGRRYEARVDRAPDYSWLTGQLFFVHADGGLWVLRYAPLWKEDPNGGSVVLARDVSMDSYREGDLVTVKGEILDSRRGSVFLGAPKYRARSIQLVDRESGR